MQLSAGEVAAAIVVGDPGSGKSRLLGEAAARTDLPNHFRVVGFEPESEVPLAAASEFLRAPATSSSSRATRTSRRYSAG